MDSFGTKEEKLGPVLTIFRNTEVDNESWTKVLEHIERIANLVKKSKSQVDFWVKPASSDENPTDPFGRPFTVYLDKLWEESSIDRFIFNGEYVQSEITLFAGCNDGQDHRLLAEISWQIAQLVNGMIGNDCFVEILKSQNEYSSIENSRIYKIAKDDFENCDFFSYQNGLTIMTPNTMKILSSLKAFRLPK